MVTLAGADGVGLGATEDDARRRDARLVRRCRGGDEAAWTALVRRFSDYVYAILTRGYGLDGSAAEDAFQEVFVRAFRGLATLADDGAVKPWIAQLTRRAAVDRLRGVRAESDLEAHAELGACDRQLELIEEAAVVRRALDQLPSIYGEVLERFFVRDQSYRVIAHELGLPAGTIASRISRGLSMLRTMLDEPARVESVGTAPVSR